MKKAHTSFCTFIMILATLSSCIEDADDNDNRLPRSNAYERLTESTEHTLLLEALELTGLDLTFKNSGSFTVFAPNDAAFTTYLNDNSIAMLSDIPRAELRNLLLNHVLQTLKRDIDFTAGYTKTSALSTDNKNLDMYVQIEPSLLLNNRVSITRANVSASNGVLHFTDNILVLPTLATLIAVNPDFAALTTALTQQNLVAALANTTTAGTNPAPFTVFAPNNAAFQALIDESTTDSLNNIADLLALPNLSDILLYHVVSGNAYRNADFNDNFTLDPITFGIYTINTTDGTAITDGLGRVVNLTERDITGVNGVLHSLNDLLRF